MPDIWSADTFSWLQQHYPDGIAQEQLDAIETELKRPAEVVRKPLSLVAVAGGN
ncbi:hypothetical protein METHPM2_1870001 [Pseudomonas sp. PM2]